MIDRAHLLDLAEEAHLWVADRHPAATGFTMRPVTRDSTSISEQAIVNTDFAVIDARMPAALAYYFRLFTPKTSSSHGYIPGSDVRRVIACWSSPTIDIPHAAFSRLATFPGNRVFKRLISLTTNKAKSKVTLKGDHYAMYHAQDGQFYPVAEGVESNVMSVTWLNKHHPGWRDALLRCEAIGMSDAETAHYILAAAPVNRIDAGMPDIVFEGP